MTTNMTKNKTERAPERRQRQRGVALVELLLITVPLCCLSIVLASAIAASSSAKQKAMWKASMQAQLATREPCGGIPLYFVPTTSSKNGQYTQGRSQAAEIGLIGLPITLTGRKTERVNEPVPRFYFETAANQMFPDRARQQQNQATFLCNEPNGGHNRGAYEAVLFGRAFAKSQELY